MDLRLPLLKLRSEVRYTINRLQPRPWGKAWVALFEAELKSVDTLTAAENKLRDALEDAEAAADTADAALDVAAKAVGRYLRDSFHGDEREALMQDLFGSQYPSEFAKPILGDQLEAMRRWPAVLKVSKHTELKDWGTKIEAALPAADDALKALVTAESSLTVFRTDLHTPLVKKIAGMRQSLLGEARKQADLTGRSAEADGLFMSHARRRRPQETIARAKVEVSELEQDLTEARKKLADLEAAQKARDEAAAQLRAHQNELEALLKARSESDARIEILRREIEKADR